jgi:hypothetical protein
MKSVGKRAVKAWAIESAPVFDSLVRDFRAQGGLEDSQTLASLEGPRRKGRRVAPRQAPSPSVGSSVAVVDVVEGAATSSAGRVLKARTSAEEFLFGAEPVSRPVEPRMEKLEVAVQRELATYIQEPSLDKLDACPLRWWSANAWRFPHLAGVATSVFAVPASTAALERLFSAAGRAVNRRRPRLRPDRACVIITGHANVVRGITGASEASAAPRAF